MCPSVLHTAYFYGKFTKGALLKDLRLVGGQVHCLGNNGCEDI